MKSLMAGIVTCALFSGASAGATGIECLGGLGRIVESAAPVVYVTTADGIVAVSDDPELIGTTPEGLPPERPAVMSPDEICTAGWVLPAPHPVDPVPGPVPEVGAPRPRPSTSVGGTRPLAGPLTLGTATVSDGVETDTGRDADDADPPAEEPSAEAPPHVTVVVASEEPTPTPAQPAPLRTNGRPQAASCRASGAGTGHGLLGLALLCLAASGRKRRGARS
jgi:hypothetical protein